MTRARHQTASSAVAVLLGAVLIAAVAGCGADRSSAAGDVTVTMTVDAPPEVTTGVAAPPVTTAPVTTAPDSPAPTTAIANPWTSPPADPRAAVAAAVAAAAQGGVQQSVVILDRVTGDVLAENDPDEQFPALSLMKMLVAADLLDDGRPLDAAIGAQFDEMIAASDDVAGSNLYQAAGADEMVRRVADNFQLSATTPSPNGRWWGNVQTSAADMASLLDQLLADPVAATEIGSSMRAATALAADGVDQRFGMRVVPGAGSKQGWGCCLSGVLGVHSMGFTDERIVVVLSAAEPDDYSLGQQDGLALQANAVGRVAIGTVTATVRAALGGPAGPDGLGSPTFIPAG